MTESELYRALGALTNNSTHPEICKKTLVFFVIYDIIAL